MTISTWWSRTHLSRDKAVLKKNIWSTWEEIWYCWWEKTDCMCIYQWIVSIRRANKKYSRWESNPRPLAYQTNALNQLSYPSYLTTSLSWTQYTTFFQIKIICENKKLKNIRDGDWTHDPWSVEPVLSRWATRTIYSYIFLGLFDKTILLM